METKEKIRDLIRRGRTKNALKLLVNGFSTQAEIDLLVSRFEKNEKKNLTGIISSSDYRTEENSIVFGILEFLEGDEDQDEGYPTERQKKKVDLKRIVWFESNPTEKPTYADEEWRMIKKEFNDGEESKQFSLSSNMAARVSDLVSELEDQKAYVVHFTGHANEEGIYLKKENQQYYHYNPENLLDVLNMMQTIPDCLFLNNCYGANISDLFANAISYVIVHEGEVTGNYSANFSKYFYHYLFKGRTIPEAFDRAKNSMLSESNGKGEAILVGKMV